MSKKEAPIIQEYNDAKCQYEYFVKGYDITESVKVLLKAHKEEYDKVKKVFDSVSGFIEAQTLYEKQLVEKDQQIAELKTQLHTQPKEIVEKIKNFMDENTVYYEEQFAEEIVKYLDKILKEYEEK